MMTKSLGFALSLSMAATGAAQALSCLPSTVQDVYHDAANAKEVYTILVGKLSFDRSKLPIVDMARQDQSPPNTDIPAQFSGRGMRANGWSNSVKDRPITLRVQCLAAWCGGMANDVEYLMFAEQVAQNKWQLTVGPCGGFAFAEPTKKMLGDLRKCMRGQECPKTNF